VKKICSWLVAVISLFVSSLGFAGGDEFSVSGKVVVYEPDKRIVITTTSEGTKEFYISPKTILQDVNGNPKNQIDLQRDFSVRIDLKKGETYATTIRPIPDVGGPDYIPTPKSPK
jgi:hypothetical protein